MCCEIPCKDITFVWQDLSFSVRLCWLILIIYFLFSSLWNCLNSLYFYRYTGQTNRPADQLPDAGRVLRNIGYSRFSCHKSWIWVFSVEPHTEIVTPPPRPSLLWMAAVIVWCAFFWGVQELGHFSRLHWKKHQRNNHLLGQCFDTVGKLFGLSLAYIISPPSTLLIKAFLK